MIGEWGTAQDGGSAEVHPIPLCNLGDISLIRDPSSASSLPEMVHVAPADSPGTASFASGHSVASRRENVVEEAPPAGLAVAGAESMVHGCVCAG